MIVLGLLIFGFIVSTIMDRFTHNNWIWQTQWRGNDSKADMSNDVIDIRDHMKPVKSVREFMERATADQKERHAVEHEVEKMRTEQDRLDITKKGQKGYW